jgi:hypothetical protein
MRDDQAQRYARHIQLPEIGPLGQTAILVATARLPMREPDPSAELLAGTYLAAAGAGALVVTGATGAQLDELGAHGADTRLTAPDAPGAHIEPHGPDQRLLAQTPARTVELMPRPAWWPGAAGDEVALAFWRGGVAAALWLTDAAAR